MCSAGIQHSPSHAATSRAQAPLDSLKTALGVTWNSKEKRGEPQSSSEILSTWGMVSAFGRMEKTTMTTPTPGFSLERLRTSHLEHSGGRCWAAPSQLWSHCCSCQAHGPRGSHSPSLTPTSHCASGALCPDTSSCSPHQAAPP